MTWAQFLHRHIGRLSPIGDLARDWMAADAPLNPESIDQVIDYLQGKGADIYLLDTAERVWRDQYGRKRGVA